MFAPKPAFRAAGLALLLAARPAQAQDFIGLRSALADRFFALIGLPHLYGDERALFLLALGCFAPLFGYVAHQALGPRGFGVIVNAALSAAGVCAALHFGLKFILSHAIRDISPFNAALLLAGAGAPLLLTAAAALKRLLGCWTRRATLALERRPLTPPKEVPPLDPKILAALRKKDP